MVYNSEEVKDPSFIILEDDILKKMVFKKSDGSTLVVPLADLGGGGATETVNHGADANVARPATATPVMWVGSVEPVNMLDGDLWLDTDAGVALMAPPKLIVPPASLTLQVASAWYIQYGAIFSRFDLAVAGTYRYLNCYIGTSSGNIHVGVVSLSGTELLDYTVVASSGIVASPGTGARRIDIGGAGGFVLPEGPGALFFWCDNTTLTAPHGIQTVHSGSRMATAITLTSAGVPASGSLSNWASNRLLTGMSLEGNV